MARLRALCFALIFPFSLFAETYYEVDLHYGIGASELSLNNVPGFALSFYPLKNFGFSAGLEYAWRQKSQGDARSGENPVAVDSEGDSIIFRWAFDNYKETLSASILQIPILFKYRNNSWYASAGVKIGAWQKTEAEVSWKNLTTSGYYPRDNVELPEPAFQGFGPQKDSSFKEKIPSKTLVMLTLEYGINVKISDNFNMLAGVFADYSLNKGIDKKTPIVERVENRNGASVDVNDNWKSWRPWGVGAQVKFAFGFSSDPAMKDSVISEPQPQPAPPRPLQVTEEVVISPDAQSDLPEYLLNRAPTYTFHYPDERTAKSDSLHLALVSQIADSLKANPSAQLHCVGYSEKLLSPSVAYETAFERAMRIRHTLVQFYGIDMKRIFTYSQGSKNTWYRRTECYYFY
jgi:hypothetical protein